MTLSEKCFVRGSGRVRGNGRVQGSRWVRGSGRVLGSGAGLGVRAGGLEVGDWHFGWNTMFKWSGLSCFRRNVAVLSQIQISPHDSYSNSFQFIPSTFWWCCFVQLSMPLLSRYHSDPKDEDGGCAKVVGSEGTTMCCHWPSTSNTYCHAWQTSELELIEGKGGGPCSYGSKWLSVKPMKDGKGREGCSRAYW